MYLRDSNYKKFGFGKFYTLDSKPAITNQDRIDNSPYVSDAASYQNIIDQLNKEEHPQFLQLVTMQNHMTYDNWYSNNQFDWADTTENLNDYERGQINTYAKGVSITDQATIDFLNQLNTIDRPVTVVFYGVVCLVLIRLLRRTKTIRWYCIKPITSSGRIRHQHRPARSSTPRTQHTRLPITSWRWQPNA